MTKFSADSTHRMAWWLRTIADELQAGIVKLVDVSAHLETVRDKEKEDAQVPEADGLKWMCWKATGHGWYDLQLALATDQPELLNAKTAPKTAIELIAAERQRQIDQKGYTPEHDDRETQGKLIRAAACYLWNAIWGRRESPPPNGWPWEPATWKPSDDTQRDLVKAGALIVAEIERIQRFRERVGLRRED